MNNHVKFCLLLSLCLPILAFAQIPHYQAYIIQYQHIAIDEMGRTGIPASVKMAQAILESGAGTSTLALKANNHFGIKCGGEWKGGTHYRKDDDYNDKGKLIPSCFRKYKSVEESFMAHSDFLLTNRRYGFLFELHKSDYHGWATGLKKAGYATSKTYASKLINLIDQYELYLLDSEAAPVTEILAVNEPIAKPPAVPIATTPTPRPQPAIVDVTGDLAMTMVNEIKSVIARTGDTPQSIAEAMMNDAGRLVRYNEFLEYANQQLQGGERVFLQPKRTSYRGKRKDHFIKANETMFDLSQMYGIRLSSLYEKNRLNPGSDPAVGSRIRLRGPKVKEHERPRIKFKGDQTPIKVPNFDFEKENNAETITASTGNSKPEMKPSRFKPVTSFSEKRKEEKPAKPWYEEEGILKEESKPLFNDKKTEATERPKIVHQGLVDNEEYTGGSKDRNTTKVEIREETKPSPAVKVNPIKEAPVVRVSVDVKDRTTETARYHIVVKGETLYRLSKTLVFL